MTVLLLLATAGCSDPIQPSTPTVQFSVLVVGHLRGGPLVGEPVTLVLPARVPLPGGARELGLPARTNDRGVATWRVEPGHAYSVIVRGVRHFEGVVVVNDSQWALSLPD